MTQKDSFIIRHNRTVETDELVFESGTHSTHVTQIQIDTSLASDPTYSFRSYIEFKENVPYDVKHTFDRLDYAGAYRYAHILAAHAKEVADVMKEYAKEGISDDGANA
jgi:hypothetical protein